MRCDEHVFLQSKLPGVIGAVDCTHIPIQSQSGQDAAIYRIENVTFL